MFGLQTGIAPAIEEVNPSKPARPTFSSITPITLYGNRQSARFFKVSSNTCGRDISRAVTELP